MPVSRLENTRKDPECSHSDFGMKPVRAIRIPPMAARSFKVGAGQLVRVTDIAGGQPGDLVAFNARNLAERFSQARTRVENGTCRMTAKGRLWTNAQPPRVMFIVTRDTAGGHDLLYTPCCRYALAKRFGVRRDGCLENLAHALVGFGIGAEDIPDPLNLFFYVGVAAGGALAIGKSRSRAGDFIELRAEMDCLVAVSACTVPRADGVNSGYLIEVFA